MADSYRVLLSNICRTAALVTPGERYSASSSDFDTEDSCDFSTRAPFAAKGLANDLQWGRFSSVAPRELRGARVCCAKS